jgi:hypothetical protein
MRSRSLFIKWRVLAVVAACLTGLLAGCSAGPLVGLVYTNVRYPLTRNLDNTPMPRTMPKEGKIIEITEPFTGLGINTRLGSNAIGKIAREHGMTTLYFADQQQFSVLGIWKSHKVILYGE